MSQLKRLLAHSLQFSVDRLLALDPEAQAKAATLSGKAVQINIADWALTLVFTFTPKTPAPTTKIVAITTDPEPTAAVILSGNSSDFLAMARQQHSGDAIFKGDLHFTGEVGTAQSFAQFWQKLELDWEEALAQHTGDIIAHQVATASRRTLAFVKQSLSEWQQNTQEQLTEELGLSPAPLEAEYFYEQVDELRSDTSRLSARLSNLQQKLQRK
ncbi:MAG: SCP2 sterol-binding domain-containing protein [Gammaproteobacteria bacterium]|nr:SCP2 sterol-binding domain-containing protein [Gammaproteobacteria bacterium]